MILSRVLSAGLIWQHDYPGISTFYLIDAVAWLGTIKISKMEFEREMPTNKATRAYYIVTFIIALSRIINPWEYRVANFWINLCKILSTAVLTLYAIYIPKDTNDNFERAEFEQFMPRKLIKLVNRLEEYISGRDLSAEMQVELGSLDSLGKSLIDLDAEKNLLTVEDAKGLKVEIQQKVMSQSEKGKLLELKLRIITSIGSSKCFAERSLGSLIDVEKALRLRYNIMDFPISYYSLPRLEIKSYLRKGGAGSEVFSTMDLKMLTASCANFLNGVASNPVFLNDHLRNFLNIRSMNFREIDLFIDRASAEEKANNTNMQKGILHFDLPKQSPRQSSPLQDKFTFRGLDRTQVLGNTKYTLFCSLGQSTWYFECTPASLIQFIQTLPNPDRSLTDKWTLALQRINGHNPVPQELTIIQSVLEEIADVSTHSNALINFVSNSTF